MPFLRPHSPVVESNSAPSHTKSAHNESTNSNGGSIQHLYVEDRHRSLSPPKFAAHELSSGPSTSSNPVVEMPSPAICDNGGVSDISAWAKSEQDSRMHIASYSEGNKIAENIQHSNKDSAGSNIVAMDNNDVCEIGHSVEIVDVEFGEGISGSGALSQSSTHRTAPLDEDVRVFLPSMPE
jgi:hypothetical protein